MNAERRTLRRRLAQRQREKAELERRVRAAQRQYQEEIAPLEEEILRRRVERLRRAAQRHMRSARHRNAYHNAQRRYEDFQEARAQPPSPPSDLKALYRRASKRCHPDRVPAPYHDEAVATFQALEAAYQAGHGQAVQAIAEALDQWGFPRKESDATSADRTHDPAHLRRAISDLEHAIQAIRGTDAYQDLAQAGDLDALLRVQKERLRERLREFQRR